MKLDEFEKGLQNEAHVASSQAEMWKNRAIASQAKLELFAEVKENFVITEKEKKEEYIPDGPSEPTSEIKQEEESPEGI